MARGQVCNNFTPRFNFNWLNKKEVIDVEGEMFHNANKESQLDSFDSFENLYIKKYYPGYSIIRTVVLFGSNASQSPVGKISLLLNDGGDILLVQQHQVYLLIH